MKNVSLFFRCTLYRNLMLKTKTFSGGKRGWCYDDVNLVSQLYMRIAKQIERLDFWIYFLLLTVLFGIDETSSVEM